MTKFCKDCKHYRPLWSKAFSAEMARCNASPPNLVSGEASMMCSEFRLSGCGPEAKLFEPAPPAPPPPPPAPNAIQLLSGTAPGYELPKFEPPKRKWWGIFD